MRFCFTCLLASVFLINPPIQGQDKYAVLVGVEIYNKDTFENLEFADEDAERLADAFGNLGFRTTKVTRDSDDASLKPSNAKNIVSVIKNRASSCGPDDTLIVSLSGHGVQFSDDEVLDSGVRETYFCPESASLQDKSTLIPISSLIEILDESEARRKLLIIDACRNDPLSDEGQRRSSARKIQLQSVHESRKSIPGGMAVLYSCESEQFSWEHDKIEQSVFSKHLAEFLEGKANSSYYDDNKLTLDGLIYFVRKRTNDYVFDNLSSNGQLPVLHNRGADWALGRLNRKTIEYGTSLGSEGALSARGTVFEIEGGKIGVVSIPQFNSKTADELRSIVDEFQTNHTQAIVLDLRHNQGGLQDQIIDSLDLFLPIGIPIFQYKKSDGTISSYNTVNREFSRLPLVVLQDRFTGGGGEVFAAAIQDNARGLIVGTSSSQGRQAIISEGGSLRIVGQNLIEGSDLSDAFKRNFFRPNGDGLQQRGVLSDVVLPNLTDHIEQQIISDWPKFDRIFRASGYSTKKLPITDGQLSNIRQSSIDRIGKSEDFKRLLVQISRSNFAQEATDSSANNLRRFNALVRDYYIDEILKIARDYQSSIGN